MMELVGPELFDFSLPVSIIVCFHVLTKEVCANNQKELSLHHGAVQTKVIGPAGWQPGYGDGKLSHGTGMATALGGDVMGVAKGVTFVPVAYSRDSTRYWVLDALDWILNDWRGRAASLDPSLAPLGVLSMSFGWPIDTAAPPGYFELRMSRWLRSLVTAGILPVASAGNDGVSNSFLTVPLDIIPDRRKYDANKA
jgi:hypothetical protein